MEKEQAVSHTEESNRKEFNDMKRKRSVSPTEIRQTSPVSSQKPEDEPDYDKYNVILSWCKFFINSNVLFCVKRGNLLCLNVRF